MPADLDTLLGLLERVKLQPYPGTALAADIFNACGFTAGRTSRRYALWSEDTRRWCSLPAILMDTEDAIRLVANAAPGKLLRLSNEYQGFRRATIGLEQGPGLNRPAPAVCAGLLVHLIAQHEGDAHAR